MARGPRLAHTDEQSCDYTKFWTYVSGTGGRCGPIGSGFPTLELGHAPPLWLGHMLSSARPAGRPGSPTGLFCKCSDPQTCLWPPTHAVRAGPRAGGTITSIAPTAFLWPQTTGAGWPFPGLLSAPLFQFQLSPLYARPSKADSPFSPAPVGLWVQVRILLFTAGWPRASYWPLFI